MKIRNIVALGITSLVIMTSISAIGGEKLVPENGKVSAVTYTLDKEISKVAYETATFGMG